MSIPEFNKGFFIFDKNWIHENRFVQSLSQAEFRILIYLLSSTLKLKKGIAGHARSEQIADLYQRKGILCVNVSQRTIAERCHTGRTTTYRTMTKFKEYGALIKMPDSDDNGNGDYHVIGFEREKEGKQDYFLLDSVFLRSGLKVPDRYQGFIAAHFRDGGFPPTKEIWEDLFGMERERCIRIGGSMVEPGVAP